MPSRERKIRELPWVHDGIGIPEMGAVQGLIYLGRYGGSFFFDMMEQSWVPEGKHLAAMESLGNLAQRESTAFRQIVDHPTVRDGISDNEAKIITVLYRVQVYHPLLVDILLTPERVMLEERSIAVPRYGKLLITIIRTEAGAARTMDLLEEAIRIEAEFMSSSWPEQQVIYFFSEELLDAIRGLGVGRGVHPGPFVASRSVVDSDDYPIENASNHFAHELGHYFFRGREVWIREGAPVFLESIVWNARRGWPVMPERSPCPYANNISGLEEVDIEQPRGEYLCSVDFGERLFHDLYRSLDETTFRQGFRKLYLLSLFDDPEAECEGTELSVCHVRAAFTTDVSEETAALAQKVINRWYDASEPYDLSLIEGTPVDPDLPQIGGRIEDAYLDHNRISVSQDIDRLLFTFRFSHRNSGPFRVPVQVVEAYEDGFAYRRHKKTLTPSDDGLETVWVSRSQPRAVGNHWVIVYDGDRKVAQVEYEVIS